MTTNRPTIFDKKIRPYVLRVVGSKEEMVVCKLRELESPNIEQIYLLSHIFHNKERVTGYIVILMKMDSELYSSILNLFGVVSWVGSQQVRCGKYSKAFPVSIGIHELENITKLIMDRKYFFKMKDITIGDLVEIKSGPLEHMTGIVSYIYSNLEIAVKIDLFGREINARIHNSNLTKV